MSPADPSLPAQELVAVPDLVVGEAGPEDAAGMVEVIHAAFGARPALDPPSTASGETPESVAAALARGTGVYARVGERPAGAILLVPESPAVMTFARVSVHPDLQRHGIASAMVGAAEALAAARGHRRVELFARQEFANLIAYWQHRGYAVDRPAPYGVVLAKPLPVAVEVPDGEAMQELGRRLAGVLAPGDLVLAAGELGAGKTTLTQGIGAGLATAGPVISPTFVLSRIHRSADGRPDLVHVDAYRLSSAEELDDLDLDATLPRSVTVVEWGRGLAEHLTDDRLEVDITARDDESRLVTLRPVGARWRDVDLRTVLAGGRG